MAEVSRQGLGAVKYGWQQVKVVACTGQLNAAGRIVVYDLPAGAEFRYHGSVRDGQFARNPEAPPVSPTPGGWMSAKGTRGLPAAPG